MELTCGPTNGKFVRTSDQAPRPCVPATRVREGSWSLRERTATFGRPAQDNEIAAMRANGINLLRIIGSPLLAASILAVGLVLFNNHVLPETNHALANLMVDVSRKRPTAQISEGVFIDGFEGYNRDRRPESTVDLPLREPGYDGGVSLRRKTSWGTPYIELLRDVSNGSGGSVAGQ